MIIPPAPSGDMGWTEPDSEAEFSEYPYNNATSTESGHLFELDDTPGYERIRLQHRTGSFTEIQSDGTEIHKIVGDGYEIIAKNKKVLVKGFCSIEVQGDSSLHVLGNVYQKVEKNVVQTVKGNMETTVQGKCSLTGRGDIIINAGGATGEVVMNAPFAVTINSDLNVTGSITANKDISAVGNVTATKKMFAVLGMGTMGGITCGYSPEALLVPGVIMSSVSVITPTIEAVKVFATGAIAGATVADATGLLSTLRVAFNTHVHPTSSPGVPTGPTPNKG